ncbi:YifB family Mg chelatase-like AAA ATPase [Clostridium sp. BJN0001]|uniref:YifB family Mg chelatase-like AAA ATPase n=1 Tax=Clostridium sp. BJN0001 TaxID=2930219 RepID=UPI001FD2C182|nr:YifB family Mg chelatase-like AAA ATPase [Clostridium sp. BJN0001]
MATKIISGTHTALDGVLVDVEIDICKGMPQFQIVGLPDVSIKEAKERVRSAIKNSGYKFPLGRITINLAPADVKKIGTLLDLPIAIGILMESNQIEKKNLDDFVILGELSLFGKINRVSGVVPIIVKSIEKDINKIIFPIDNIDEVDFINRGIYYPFETLKEVISFITYNDVLPYEKKEKTEKKDFLDALRFENIIGHYSSKRAIEIAVSGGHNIILYGEPGCGKTMLAKAIPTIMPELTYEEKLDVIKIYSIIGMTKESQFSYPPFRSPHHTITNMGLIGGGKDVKPGEITLAHKGVLFLDEFLEFKKETLEALLEPLEEKSINIIRRNRSYKMPADFLLVGAFNPSEHKDIDMEKSSYTYANISRKYLRKISDALLDRIDIMNHVPKLKYEELKNIDKENISSKDMKEKVRNARRMQKERYKGTIYKLNSDVKGKEIFDICRINKKCKDILEYYYNTSGVSIRGFGKVIKLARTIADIENENDIKDMHIIEAIQYRKNINGDVI